MSGIRAEFSISDEDYNDLDALVDRIRIGVSSLFQERSMCEMLGIDFDKSASGLDPAAKLSLLNHINELKFGSQFENETVYPGDPVLLQTEESSELIKASCIFEVLGFEQLAKNMRRFYSETLIETMMKGVREEAKAKKIISADRSKAKKGKTNRHQSVALEIATRTWEKYPNASLAGLSQEIYTHLRIKWNDVPVVGTIEKWLKESGLNPDVKPKNRAFKIVTPEGE
ncbi:hypothetical protein [Citrobacter portucalensis]|uniref:hypothetical protein n=1 Tax=Citrobacter portucalensis TaxID=1639133 RepID=UPI0023B27EC5|nr:hypothetical protein [Citrobacter portucalensis]MDE9691476.1 hypothetical protein [Citrobacter portucalensis]